MEGYLIELGGVQKGYFRRNHYTPIDDTFDDEVIEYLEATKNTDVYYSVYTYENEDIDNCHIYAPLYFDLDLEFENNADFRKIIRDALLVVSYLEDEFGIPEDLIQIYFSGSKGFHILVEPEVFGIKPSTDLNMQFKKIAQEVNKNTLFHSIDTKIYDRRRLFRFPNSINGKTGLYKVPITMDDLRTMDYEKIQEYASEPREVEIAEPRLVETARKKFKQILLVNKLKDAKRRNKNKSKVSISTERKDLLPCVKKILNEGAAKGSRNNTCVAIASSMLQSGMTQTEVIDELLTWNEKNDPPLPEREILTTAKSAYSLVQSGRGYGCTFYQEHDYCVGKTCPLFKK
ncbi:primase C-terminal domain-containing protein [Heyndrickxia sporothermodurans]|uniref:primase C-terminal domain-containing protein n=1 Tax=Heyndrickxia sporothermodurans TaxID=46224 RepID=UPI000D34FECF|nr:primase C-terminal domain-containing protein [Heyndrickxia sporothermodurans]PTY93094.1 hypothetical protein B5V90_03140 [Heyndrickxia sporothermodurans]